MYTTQEVYTEGLFASILASLGRPCLSLPLPPPPLVSRRLSFRLLLSLWFASSSRRPRCIPRGSPLDIVAPRRLVRVSFLPCLFFFPFDPFSIRSVPVPAPIYAPIPLRDTAIETEHFTPSSRVTRCDELPQCSFHLPQLGYPSRFHPDRFYTLCGPLLAARRHGAFRGGPPLDIVTPRSDPCLFILSTLLP